MTSHSKTFRLQLVVKRYWPGTSAGSRLHGTLCHAPCLSITFTDESADGRPSQRARAIEEVFGARTGGFDTYRYYVGNTTLRAWICIPLVMGITSRKDETLSALFSPGLWGERGLFTEEGRDAAWDRSTLYALRGAFAVGDAERSLRHLELFSASRLLGEHVPYAVEENYGRQLSAESALYCRIITEGIFGIRPQGLATFELAPSLPEAWE